MYIKTFVNKLRSKHPDCVVLLRRDNKYLLLSEDAQVAKDVLGIAPKTYGREELPIASFPESDIDTCLQKLIAAGHRVILGEYPFVPTVNESGMFSWTGAETLNRYMELNNQHPDDSQYGVFFAFSNKQSAEGVKKLVRQGYIKEGEDGLIRSYGGGLCGISSEVERFLDFYKERKKLIAEECDPYEVYCYEYNNHESCISWDGDLEAIRLVVDYWGADVARTICRRSEYYSIESIENR